MEYRKSRAITLRRDNFRESSQVVRLYTRDYGRINALARGARKARNDSEGPLDLLSYGQVSYFYKPANALYLITGIKVYDNFPALRNDYARARAGMYLANFVETLTALEDKNTGLFDLLLKALESINGAEEIDCFLVPAFEAQALKCLGYLPLDTDNQRRATTDVAALLNTLAGGKVAFDRLRAAPATLRRLRRFLNDYIARIAGDELICAPSETA